MITGIHGADVNFLVGKDHNYPVSNVNHDPLIDIRAFDREFLQRLKIWLSAPRARITRINVCCDQPAIRLHPQNYLAPVGAPALVQTRGHQPRAIEIDALGRPPTINLASATAWSAVLAPCSGRLVESVDPNELAAQRTIPATSPGHDRNFVSLVGTWRSFLGASGLSVIQIGTAPARSSALQCDQSSMTSFACDHSQAADRSA
jgi:hypothetical protein